MEGIVSTVAQFDNDQKAERTAAGMQAALQLGRWTFKAPLGYLNSRIKTGPSLLPDTTRTDLIRRAFRQVAEGHAVADVLREVNAAGLKSKGRQTLPSVPAGPAKEFHPGRPDRGTKVEHQPTRRL